MIYVKLISNFKIMPTHNAIRVTCNGKTYISISALAKTFKLNPAIVSRRIRNGFTPEQAVLLKFREPKTTGHRIIVGNKTYSSMTKAAKAHGLDHRVVWLRIKKGRTIKEAFGLKEFNYSSKPKKIIIGKNKFRSLRDACRFYGVDKYVLNARINRYGWTIRQALEVDRRPGYEKGILGYVYLIKNLISKQNYVGITMGLLNDRLEQHIDKAFSKKKLDPRGLHAAIKKFGPKVFKIKKIGKAKSEGELLEKEMKWIKIYKSLAPKGYNLNSGGTGTRTTGIKTIVGKKSFKSIVAACRYFNLNSDTERREVTRRINKGATPEEAIRSMEN